MKPIKINIYETIRWVYASSCALLFLNLRPTAIGESYSLQVSILLTFANMMMCVYLILSHVNIKNYKSTTYNILLSLTICLYSTFRFAASTSDLIGFKGLLIGINSLVTLYFIIGIPSIRRKFFDSVAIILFFALLSLVISAVLLYMGSTVESLRVAKINYTYDGLGDVVFPFTFVANPTHILNVDTYRLCGIFREPGILPVFACWAATYTYYRGYPLVVSLICLMASVLSLSTMGPLAFFTGALILCDRFRVRPTISLSVVLIIGICVWPYIYSMDTIGLEDKMNSGSGSYIERADLMTMVLGTKNIIFGDGSGWSIYRTEAISLVASIRSLGIFYFAICMIFFLHPIRNFGYWVCGLFPALLTMLVSQPISADPLVQMIFFSWAAIYDPRTIRFNFRPREIIASRNRGIMNWFSFFGREKVASMHKKAGLKRNPARGFRIGHWR